MRHGLRELLEEHRRGCLMVANAVGQARRLAEQRRDGRQAAVLRLVRIEDACRQAFAAARDPTRPRPSGIAGRLCAHTLRSRVRDLHEAEVLARTLANRWHRSLAPPPDGPTATAAGRSAGDLREHKRRNLHLNDLEVLAGHSELASGPSVLFPDLGGVCNLRCPTCPCHGPESEHLTLLGVASPAVLDRLCGALAVAENVGIFGSGEPLLSPLLARVLHEAAASGCRLELATNGTLPERAAAVVPPGPACTLVVSIDGATPETFGALRAGARLDDVVAGIRRLRRERPDLPLAFNVTVSRPNIAELPRIVELAGELGVGSVRLSPLLDFHASHYWRRWALRPRDVIAYRQSVAAARRIASTTGVTVADGAGQAPPRAEGLPTWWFRRRRERAATVRAARYRRLPDDGVLSRIEALAAHALAFPVALAETRPAAPARPARDLGLPEMPVDTIATLERDLRRDLGRGGAARVPYCFAPFRVAVTHPGGGISPCCVITDLFGDFSAAPFHEAWNSPAFVALRSSMLTGEGLPAPCRTCRDPLRLVRMDSFVATLCALGVDASLDLGDGGFTPPATALRITGREPDGEGAFGQRSVQPGAGIRPRPSFLRAAYYFGDECPLSFWSSDHSGAATDFRRLRDDGFDALGLAVPWSAFQPRIGPVRFDERALARLAALLETAHGAGLGVVLRLGYLWDQAEQADWPGLARFERLYTDDAALAAWQEYLARLHGVASASSVVRLAFVSWEDLWYPVLNLLPRWPREKRLAFLAATGFERFVRERYPESELALIAGRGRSPAAPLEPEPGKPSFRLWLEFLDHTLVERFNPCAQRAYPGVCCEARTDWDQVAEPDGGSRWHVHDSGYRLPGARLSVAYSSVSMGATNRGDRQAAAEALNRLAATLADIERRAGEPVFLAQFSFAENAPGFAHNTAVVEGELDRYIVGAAGPLLRHCAGYGLWTWRDYAVNLIYNPTFALGLEGWETSGEVGAGTGPDGAPHARLAAGAAVTQLVPRGRDPYAEAATHLNVEVAARRDDGGPATIAVRLGELVWPVSTSPADGTGSLHLAYPAGDSLRLEIRAASDGRVRLGPIRLYSFVQRAGVRHRDGSEGPLCSAIRRLNATLAAAGDSPW